MTAPSPPPNPSSRRPSLMASGSAAGRPDTSDDDQSFSVSILSAASTGRAAEPSARRSPQPQRSSRRHVAWWLGVAVISLALLAVARWQQPGKADTPPAQDAVLMAALAASAAAQATSAPAPASLMADAASAAASQPLTEALGATAGAATASAPVAPDTTPQRNPFDKFAEVAPTAAPAAAARKAAAPAKPEKPSATAQARAAAPTRAAPAAASAAPRDRDAELVAALMANADAGREFQLSKAAAPLSTAERNRFASELRQCQQKHSSTAARDACRAKACQTRGYAGRTKSCPAAPAPSPAEASGSTA